MEHILMEARWTGEMHLPKPTRVTGSLTHRGGYSLFKIDTMGGGWVAWRDNVGLGSYTEGSTRFVLELRYLGEGSYEFDMASELGTTATGVIREDVSAAPRWKLAHTDTAPIEPDTAPTSHAEQSAVGGEADVTPTTATG